MWQRYTLYDFRVIAHYLGVLLVYTGASMLIPFIVALLFREWEPASRYFVAVGAALTIGSSMRMLRIEPGRLSRQQAIAVTGFAWVVVAAVAAVPLAFSAHYNTYFDALFDSVSAFTGTGAAIILDPDHLSNADNMWRFISAYAGGVGLVVVAMSFGLFGRVSDTNLYESEAHNDHIVPNVVQTARFILGFSLSVIAIATVVLAIVFLLHGMNGSRSVLHAFWLAISGYMTVGIAPMSTSIGYYHSVWVEGILVTLMLMGSVSFAIQSEVLRGRLKAFFHDIEIRTDVLWITLLIVVFTCSMAASAVMRTLPDLARTGFFNLISAATTTGFTTLNSNQLTSVLPSGALLIIALAMAVGGSSGSTSGGIKLKRVAVFAMSAFETLKGVASPESARIVTTYYHIGCHRLQSDEVKSAMTVSIMFILTYIIGALAGIAFGYDAVSAITESVAMASNGGISTGITTESMPLLLKFIYILEMWAGRLEFVTLLAVGIKIFVSLKPRNWSFRKGSRS